MYIKLLNHNYIAEHVQYFILKTYYFTNDFVGDSSTFVNNTLGKLQ